MRTSKPAKTASRPPTSVDEYLSRLPEDQRAALERLRTLVRAAAPAADECINYGVCALRLNGDVIVGFGATRTHCAMYLFSGSTIADHRDALARYDTTKGAIRFQAGSPLPAALVRRLVRARIAENKA